MQFRACKLWQTTSKSPKQRRGLFFYKEERGVGKGWFFEQNPLEEREFRVMAASH